MSAPRGLDAVFSPRRVAVVGASQDPGKTGAVVMANLGGFDGEVVWVGSGDRLVDVEGPVDLAVLAVPAAAVPQVVADAAAAGVAAVVVLAGGFAETGEEGAALQAAAVAAARGGGVRLVGPNCFGVQNAATGLNASIARGALPRGGDIALMTQSGAYGMALHDLGAVEDLRFSKVYSAGNSAEIGHAEVLAHLGADPETAVVCCFLESIGDGRAFCEAVRAVAAETPVLVAKTGRSAAGARAAASHTAALAGEAEVWSGALAQAGAVQARTGQELLDAAKALDWQPVAAGPRVGIVTNSGGVGVELTDLLVEHGLEVPELSDDLQAELAALLPAHGSPRNPVDTTPAWPRFAELYAGSLEALAASGEVDAVILVLLHRAALDEAVTDAVLAAAQRGLRCPVFVCWVAPPSAEPNRRRLQAGRVPCFEWPERTARAAANAVRSGRARSTARPAPAWPRRPPGLPRLTAGFLAPDDAVELVAAFGIAVPPQALCATPSEAADAAAGLGWPVVAKLASADLVHKTEAGAVRTGLHDHDAVLGAAADLLRLDPSGRVLVQDQLDGVEVIVGGYADAGLGPVLLVGLGGVHVEVLRDTAFRLAPVDADEAAAVLRGLRGFPLLGGARGRAPVDLPALARLVAAASRLLAAVPEVAELDLNPVIASPAGAAAVDVRVRCAPPSSAEEGPRRLAPGGIEHAPAAAPTVRPPPPTRPQESTCE